MVVKERNNILIVDNEVMIRKLLNNRLKSAGYRCDEATSSDQALLKLANREFDLVILDVAMPSIPVVELLPKILDEYPNTAIIVATPVGGTNVGIECIKLGAYE